MPRTFSLRLLKATWGIAIDLQAQSYYSDDVSDDLIRVGERTWMDVSKISLAEQDIPQLIFGLALACPMIERQHTSGHIVVVLLQVDYTPTDYQAEGMAAAMLGWAVEEFELEPPEVTVDFDTMENRYIFHW